jgi:hypothetical protein
MSINIKKSHGSKIDLPYYPNKLSTYKKFPLIYSKDMFHATIINKELFNLVIYNEDDYDDIVEMLIRKKYYNISFDFNHINDPVLLICLLEHDFNMPYILQDSTLNKPTFNLIYSPKLEPININYISYMLDEYNSQDKKVCKAWATFNKETLLYIKSKIVDEKIKGETSGELMICEAIDEVDKIVFEVCKGNKIKGGNKDEVDSIESRYNFHTHPVCSYKKINTELGWPSYDDYLIFIMAFIFDKKPTHFHWICSVEGIYVLTIPRRSVEVLKVLKVKNYNKLEKNIEKYLQKNVDVNKVGFNKETGILMGDYLIKDVSSYLQYVSNASDFNIDGVDIKLFDIQFFEWGGDLGLLTNDRMYFTFYYPKIGGNCIMKSEHIRE